MKPCTLIMLTFLLMGINLFAQHIPKPPGVIHPPRPSGYVPTPPVYDPETHQEIVNDVKDVIDHFNKINDPSAGLIDFNDTVNRMMKHPFPTLYVYTTFEFPDKVTDNFSNQTYLHDYSIVSKKFYEVEKKNKFDDVRAIIDYKKGSMINLTTTKDGKKKATEIAFQTLNMAPDGSLKIINADPAYGSQSVEKTEEFKEIAGNKCQKYIKSDETGTFEVWMAQRADFVNEQLTEGLIKAFFIHSGIPNTFGDYKTVLKGIPVQLVYKPKSKFAQKCVVTHEKMQPWTYEPAIFSTEGYEVIELKTLQDVFNSR